MKDKFNLFVCHIVIIFVCIFISSCASINGYCEAALKLAPESLQVIEGGANTMSMTGFNFGALNPIAAPALYDQVNRLLDSQFGYNIDDALTDSWTEINSSENNMNALTNYVQDKNTMYDNLKQAINFTWGSDLNTLTQNGYRFFSQSVPQFGNNAKSFFIGKIDSATGVISDVQSNIVTKFTSQGLNNFQSVFDSLSDSGDIYNYSEADMPLCGNTFDFYFIADSFDSNPTRLRAHIVLNKFCILTSSNGIVNGVYQYADGPKFYYIPDGSNLSCISCSVVNEYGNLVTNNPSDIYFNSQSTTHSIGGVNYKMGNFAYGNYYARSSGVIPSSYYFSTNWQNDNTKVELFKSILSSGSYQVPLGITFNYDTSALSNQLKAQLQRLVNHYIDSATLNRINDVLSTITYTPNVNNPDLAVQPTQEIVSNIQSIIDNALAYDPAYQLAFDEYYNTAVSPEPEPEPDPEPDTGNTGTPIPEPFPIPAFEPIIQSVGSMFDLVSIFEPIFLIFGAIGGLFSFWLLVPFVLLFMIIIRLLK